MPHLPARSGYDEQLGTNGARVDCDVLVVGLGPAGASAATYAARAGASVLAIDRKREVGKPVQCAEFVPAMIGQDKRVLEVAWRQPIRSMTTYVEHAVPHVKAEFPGHMIDRSAFDAALVDNARRAGAVCELDVALRGLDQAGTVRLSDGRVVRCRVVVGADGPRSAVGRAIGHVNIELAETRQVTLPLLAPFEATDIFLSADLPGGYGWLFPKSAVANLGVGVASHARHRLKPLLEALHRRLVEEGRVGKSPLAHTGGAIPVGGLLTPNGRLGGTHVLLAGDAAGLTNPVTGAGINQAVQSGSLAGGAAAALTHGDDSAGRAYAEELEDTFGPSLERALRRRRELLSLYDEGGEPGIGDLKRGWIAFPDYWMAEGQVPR